MFDSVFSFPTCNSINHPRSQNIILWSVCSIDMLCWCSGIDNLYMECCVHGTPKGSLGLLSDPFQFIFTPYTENTRRILAKGQEASPVSACVMLFSFMGPEAKLSMSLVAIDKTYWSAFNFTRVFLLSSWCHFPVTWNISGWSKDLEADRFHHSRAQLIQKL